MRNNGTVRRFDEPVAQLSTRIPKDLHRRLKLHCVTREIAVQDFVVEAIREKLGGSRSKRRRPRTADRSLVYASGRT